MLNKYEVMKWLMSSEFYQGDSAHVISKGLNDWAADVWPHGLSPGQGGS